MDRPKNPAELVKKRFFIPQLDLYGCFEYRGKVYQIDNIEIRETKETIDLAIGGCNVSFLVHDETPGG